MSIPERLTGLRAAMRDHGLTHYLVPSADEHINEYLPVWRERRAWASGFTGSAGDLLLALAEDETFLFTDGRYHLQAEEQLEGSGIGLKKVGQKDVKGLGETLEELAKRHGTAMKLGYDAAVLAIDAEASLRKRIEPHGAGFDAVAGNLVDGLWTDRPTPPETRLIACPAEWTGADLAAKARTLREELAKLDADAIAVVRLDQIAWFTNLRSTDDVPYNPVFESFLYVDGAGVHLFLRAPDRRLPDGFGAAVAGFAMHPYDAFVDFLRDLGGGRVLVDPERTTAAILAALVKNQRVKVVRGLSPIESRKAIKNATELECMRRANLMASVAKTRALIWLDKRVAAGDVVTERSFKERIESYYAEIDGFRGLSFNTISSTGPHGAIIHYGAADETPLEKGDLFLIDSGIQMDGGTTDDTRTVLVGEGTDEQRRKYTLVLKGHIHAARQVFPEGTAGAAIDAITRAPLWSDALNYDHGTGHGVGAFLNVHEGPFGIAETKRRGYAARALEPGMITSIEPGYYEKTFGGVRLENLYTVEARQVGDGSRAWHGFAALTWIPFDRRLIVRSLLDEADRAWLDGYHAECRARLEPHLDEVERDALRTMTA